MRPYLCNKYTLKELGQETKHKSRPIILEVLLGETGLFDKRYFCGIFEGFWKIPFLRDKLISLATDGRKISMYLLTRNVGKDQRSMSLLGIP